MKTFREFILECELVEGKVEWDNPKRPLQSGLTPREKNRAKRIFTGVENPNKVSFGGMSFDLSDKDYERYGKLKAAHDSQKDKKVPRDKRHNFKQLENIEGTKIGTKGRIRRTNKDHKNIKRKNDLDLYKNIDSLYRNSERQKVYHHNDLKEPKN